MLGTNGAALCGGVGRHAGCLGSRCWAFAGVSGRCLRTDGVERMLWEWWKLPSIKRREPRRGALTSRSHLEVCPTAGGCFAPFHRPVPRTPPTAHQMPSFSAPMSGTVAMVVSSSMGCGGHSAAPAESAGPKSRSLRGGHRDDDRGMHQQENGGSGPVMVPIAVAGIQGTSSGPKAPNVDVAMAGETTRGRGRVGQDIGVGEKHGHFGLGVVSVSLHGIGSWKKRLQNKETIPSARGRTKSGASFNVTPRR